eukprot:3660109-Alexandrium_andersonii.AAC.1
MTHAMRRVRIRQLHPRPVCSPRGVPLGLAIQERLVELLLPQWPLLTRVHAGMMSCNARCRLQNSDQRAVHTPLPPGPAMPGRLQIARPLRYA